MRTYNIPPCYRKIKEILIIPPDLALLSILIGSNYPCLELVFMVPKVFEPLKFDCIFFFNLSMYLCGSNSFTACMQEERSHLELVCS